MNAIVIGHTMRESKQKILVTGANGQLGRTLQQKAKTRQEYQWFFFNKTELDITKEADIETIIKRIRPQFCINTAAYTNVSKAEKEKEKTRQINVTAVAHLAKVCSQHNTRLIHLSTDYVFDGAQEHPYTEEDPTNPINEYGRTKALGEQEVLKLKDKHYVVRTAWLYAKTHGHNFYRSILEKAKAGKPLKVVNDQRGTPTTTEHLSDFLIQLIQTTPKAGIYHCAGEKIQSRYAFAADILNEHGLNVLIEEILSPKGGVKRPKYSAIKSIKPV